MEQNEAILQKGELALSNVLALMPWLAGLAAHVRLQLDERVGTAAVFASGRLLFNPTWLEMLPLGDATFVMAHELMHLMLLTHERAEGEIPVIVNIAHDIIINQMLEQEMGIRTPAKGITYKSVIKQESQYRFEALPGVSLEETTALLKAYGDKDTLNNVSCWSLYPADQETVESKTPLGEMLGDLMSLPSARRPPILKPRKLMDVFSEAEERQMFPGERSSNIKKETAETKQLAIEAMAIHEIQVAMEKNVTKSASGRGTSAGHSTFSIEMLRSHYSTPWQWALQQWMESTAPSSNTYARTSRRGQYPDFVRPGKKRTGETLHILLDTSGSMSYVLPLILGTITSFCEATGVDTIHMIQCDTQVAADEWLPVAGLQKFTAYGFGGSDMSPGMERLAADPEVERIIVITDGDIFFPRHEMPYEVLWVVTQNHERFNPGYGRVIGIEM